MNNNKKLSAVLSEYAAFIALILLALGLCIISPEFRQVSNLLNLLRQAAFNGLIAIGMTCVILSDGIDLSVGSVFALAAIICAEMLTSGIPAPVAILAALVIGIGMAVDANVITFSRIKDELKLSINNIKNHSHPTIILTH